MILYHFTAPTRSHLGSIVQEGRIRTTDNMLDPKKANFKPGVVWLTKNPAGCRGWTDGASLKAAAVVGVEIPDKEAHKWSTWAKVHRMPDWWYAMTCKTGGDPQNYYVVERPIKAAEFVYIKIASPAFEEIAWEQKGERDIGHVNGHVDTFAPDEFDKVFPYLYDMFVL